MVPSVDALAAKHRQWMRPWRLADLESVRQVLAAKDASGVSKVLQLPIGPWPEVGNIGSFSAVLYLRSQRIADEVEFRATSVQPAYVDT
jgi:hypothetical protein